MSGEIRERNYEMIILGVALLLLGALLDIGILYTIGGIVAVVGVLLWLFGALGRQIGPRPHYY
jgi:membrane protein implicated in regulation of membrane protease activity